ncbi:MAG: serine hydrolase [Tardiphaga sp.]|nr:serine hydrolase [Tardiphaga sp.]
MTIAPRLMTGFPAPEQQQVTIANWRTAPFSRWGFQNVRELLPTANIARSDSPTSLPSEPRYLDDVTFAGLDGAAMTLPQGLRAIDTDGFIALHRGRVVAEWYANGLTPSTQHLIFSVSKSFCGTLGGILVAAGKLDPDALVVSYVPEMKGSVYGDCTVRHLLDMSVGIEFNEDYLATEGSIVDYRRATGWDPVPAGAPAAPHLRAFLTTLKHDGTPHGETFHYVSTNTDLLGWVYERACNKPYAKILQDELWAPMGAESDAYIAVDSHGAARAAGGICATLRDLARFGEMMRNNGVSNGRPVVPNDWVHDIRKNGDAAAWSRGKFTVLFPNGNYRSKWYTPDVAREAFSAIGIHGQWIYIDPQAETVIVRVSSQAIPFDMPKDVLWLGACRAIADRLSQ